jgi:hypothetical protein
MTCPAEVVLKSKANSLVARALATKSLADTAPVAAAFVAVAAGNEVAAVETTVDETVLVSAVVADADEVVDAGANVGVDAGVEEPQALSVAATVSRPAMTPSDRKRNIIPPFCYSIGSNEL